MNIESCVEPGEDFFDQGRTDELFPKQQREVLMSEKIADDAIMEAGDMVESAIRYCVNRPMNREYVLTEETVFIPNYF